MCESLTGVTRERAWAQIDIVNFFLPVILFPGTFPINKFFHIMFMRRYMR